VEIEINILIQKVTAQVISELQTRGVQVVHKGTAGDYVQSLKTKSEKIDMKKYRTPVLTEDHIRRLHELTGEIIIPRGTVITPKARELVRKNQIIITFS
jgi:hypothetical protein